MPDVTPAPSITPPIRLDTIIPRSLQWLWYPRLPIGRLSLLVGHPDRGKSLFACTCAAHVSRGRPWPDGSPCPQGLVIFLEAEDTLEETVVPRLQAAEADLTQILTWKERNLAHLLRHMETFRPRLVVLSPLNTYLPRINTWSDQEVRRALQPLSDVAATMHAAFLGIMHPPKAKQAIPIHFIGGSIAFGAVARSVLAVERGEDGLYLIEGLKQNLSQSIPPIGYYIRPSILNSAIPVLDWRLVPPTSSFAPPDDDQSALAEACEFLRMVLHGDPIKTTVLKASADKNGIAWRTIMRARKVLRVHAVRVFEGSRSHWELSLPPDLPTARVPNE